MKQQEFTDYLNARLYGGKVKTKPNTANQEIDAEKLMRGKTYFFDGSVTINGDVQSNVIATENLTIRGSIIGESSKAIAGNDLVITQGVYFDSQAIAGHDLTVAKALHNATLIAGHDIRIEPSPNDSLPDAALLHSATAFAGNSFLTQGTLYHSASAHARNEIGGSRIHNATKRSNWALPDIGVHQLIESLIQLNKQVPQNKALEPARKPGSQPLTPPSDQFTGNYNYTSIDVPTNPDTFSSKGTLPAHHYDALPAPADVASFSGKSAMDHQYKATDVVVSPPTFASRVPPSRDLTQLWVPSYRNGEDSLVAEQTGRKR